MPRVFKEVDVFASGAETAAIGVITPKQRRHFLCSLMLAASALAIIVATPEDAFAACTPAAPVVGDTVTCTAGVYGPLSWAVDDLTVVIGDNVSASTITGGASIGISMVGYSGDQDLTVLNSGSSIIGNSHGILVSGQGTTVDVSVNVEGSVQGFHGIGANNLGTGSTTVQAGTVTGTGGFGIDALTFGTDVTVGATGDVYGGTVGIRTRNFGSGTTSITATNVTGGAMGIEAYGDASSGGISVSTSGYVLGITNDGIEVRNLGVGDAVVSAYNVVGGIDGIEVLNFSTGAIDVAAVNVSGGQDGIGVLNSASGTDVTIGTTGTVYGTLRGIYSRNLGSGSSTINVYNVGSSITYGIWARNSGTDLSVTSTGTVYGGTHGLVAVNYGSGSTTIVANNVYGGTGRGIWAYGDASTTSMSVTTYGTVSGGTDGIWACNEGSGGTSITTNGSTTGASGDGIYTCSNVVTNGYTFGGTNGINVNHTHADGASVTTNLGATVGASGTGIRVYNSAAGSTITIDANTYTYGGTHGIAALNFGTGSVDIDATDVTAGSGFGVYAYNSGTGPDIDITTTGTVSAGHNGIYAFNLGSGEVDIDAYEVHSLTSGSGIVVGNVGTSIDVDVTGPLTGFFNGIYTYNFGSGDTDVDVVSTTGYNQNGIFARQGASAGSVLIDATSLVIGAIDGVHVNNLGTGGVVLSVVDVTGATGNGVYAHNDGTGISVTATGAVYGGTNGIFANNDGSTSIVISTVGVTGASNDGIYANNSSNGTHIAITTTDSVVGGVDGIQTRNYGSGDTIISTVDVTAGATGTGILVYSDASTRDSKVTATGTVSAGVHGIHVVNLGDGTTEVVAVDVTGTTGYGIYARGNGDATVYHPPSKIYQSDGVTPVYETIATKTYVNYGSYLYTPGGDPLMGPYFDVYGNVVTYGGCEFGVDVPCDFIPKHQREVLGVNVVSVYGPNYLYSAPFTTYPGVSVTAQGAVYGGTTGIRTVNTGEGTTNILATSTVTGASGRGIWAYNDASALDINITAQDDVTGYTDGILTTNLGVGATLVSAIDVTGTTGRAVDVYGGVTSTNITVALAESVFHGNSSLSHVESTVTGYADGVRVRNQGTGTTLVLAVDVTGQTGRGIDIYGGASTNDLTVSAGTTYFSDTGEVLSTGGLVSGHLDGIRAINTGTGATSVSAVNVTSTTGVGILVSGQGTEVLRNAVVFDPGVAVATTGDVTGYTDGIHVTNTGLGSTSVYANNVTGQTGRGVYVYSGASTTTTSVLTNGTIYGYTDGIWSCGIGTGAGGVGVNSITTYGTVTGKTGDGIYACSEINANAYVYGGVNGINVNHMGVDGVTITAVDVVGGITGINVYNPGTATFVDIKDTATVTGGYDGIEVDNLGTEHIVLDIYKVYGTAGRGIDARNAGTYIDIQVAHTAAGYYHGIYALSTGSGTIDVNALYTSAAVYNAIHTYAASGTGINITSTGLAAGGTSGSGIYAYNGGNGNIVIHATNATGGLNAVTALAGATNGNIGVTTTGTISGGVNGIVVSNGGTGHSVVNASSVTGTTGVGIYARTDGTYIDVQSTGTVYGGSYGVLLNNNGSSTTKLQAYNVYSGGTGILAYTDGTDLSINVTGELYGAVNGVRAFNYGTGSTDINVVGATGNTGIGIFAYTDASTTDLLISATAAVYGGLVGVYGRHSGTDLTVTLTGGSYGGNDGIFLTSNGSGSVNVNATNVVGNSGTGVFVYAGASTSNLSVITTGTVYGGTNGIWACGTGSGGTYIHTYGTVTGATGTGIYACSTVIAEDHVYGGTNGIVVNHGGTDGVTISATSVVGATGDGIYAYNSAAGTYVVIDVSSYVYGGNEGIAVTNSGSGTTTINAVDVNGAGSFGVRAWNFGATTGIEINTTGTVNGDHNGIYAWSNGSGAININAYNVHSTSAGSGVVSANQLGTDNNITVTGALTGYWDGVQAWNNGTGSTTINVVTSYGYNGVGLFASQDASADAISITATGTVYGGLSGILAYNGGTGLTTVSAVDVTGANGRGIYAKSAGAGVSINTTGTVYGWSNGIGVYHTGTGDIDIDAVDVTGAMFVGLYSYNGAAGTNNYIDVTGTVSGGLFGLYSKSQGSGATTINVVDVNGYGITGLYARNSGTDLSMTSTGTIYGATYGAVLRNYGTGTTTATVVDVTGLTTGLMVNSSGSGVQVTATGTVMGGSNGLWVLNQGSGTTVVDTYNATGTSGYGVYVRANAGTGEVTVSATGTTYGGFAGTAVTSLGAGPVTVNAGSYTYGGTYGIWTATVTGATVNVLAGQSVVSPGAAIITHDSTGADADDVINAAGTIVGSIFTMDGQDTLNLSGGSVTGFINMGSQNDTVNWSASTIYGKMLGGDDYDTLNVSLAGGGGWVASGTGLDLIDEFEELNFLTGNWYVNGTTTVDYDLITFQATGNTLVGNLDAGEVVIFDGATLNLGNGGSQTGDMLNNGTLFSNGSSVGSFSVGGDFENGATGLFLVDVPETGVGDLLTVSGGVTLDGTISVNHGPFIYAGTTTLIDGGTSLTGTFDTVWGLFENGILLSQSIVYDDVNYDVLLSSEIDPNGTLRTLSPNHRNVLGGLMNVLGGESATGPDLLLFAQSIGGIQTIEGLNNAARELYPGILDAATIISDDAQRRFNRQLQNDAGDLDLPQNHRVELDDRMSLWASIGIANHGEREGGNRYVSYEGNAVDIRGGISDIDLGGPTVGFAAGISRSNVFTLGGGVDDGTIRTGLVGAHANVPINADSIGIGAHMDGTLSMAWHGGELDRRVLINEIDHDDRNQGHFSASSTEMDVRVTMDTWQDNLLPVRPLATFGFRSFNMDSYNEKGGITALEYDEVQLWYRYAGIGAEFRQEWGPNHWMLLRATGMSFLPDERNEYRSEFVAAAENITEFESYGERISSALLFEGSMGYITQNDFSIGLDGFAQLSVGEDSMDGAGHRANIGGTLRISRSF